MADMDASSGSPVERARKTVKCVLQALSGTPATAVAAAMGVSEPTISRLKNEHLGSFAAMLAHLGLKVVPVEARCFDPRYIEALQTLAEAELARQKNPPHLEFDE